MMKKLKKLSALFLIFAMVLSTFAGIGLEAKAEEGNKIVITKYQITSQEDYDALNKRADGKPITDDSLKDYTVLGGVEFRLSKAKDVNEDTTVNNVKLDTTFEPLTAVTDNTTGVATFGGLDDGYYLLEEVKGANVTEGMDPVLIQLPLPFEGEDPLTEVYVYPKNLVNPDAPEIEKDVIVDGNNDAGVNRGESFKWIVKATIPADINQGSVYQITDQLDTRLDFDTTVDPVVTAGEQLNSGTDYTFTPGADNRSLVFDFTAAGRTKLADSGADKVEITFYTKVNDTAELGVSIPNQANLTYTNSTNQTYNTKSDRPEVHTGGFAIHKVDKTTGASLPGAKFGIYANKADAEGKTNAIQEVTSDSNGYVVFDGLAYGVNGESTLKGKTTYYVAELEAPVVNGVTYNLLTDVLEVEVDATSHETATALKVENDKNTFGLPFTGGVGTVVFTLSGIAMLGAAYVLIVKGRKNEKA